MHSELVQRTLRTTLVVGVTLVIFTIIYFTFPYIYPIIIAYILALLFQPVVTWLEKNLRFPRILAIISTVASFLTVCTGILFLTITELYQGTLFLADRIPSHYQEFIQFLEEMFYTHVLPLYERVLFFIDSLDEGYQETIQSYIASLTDLIASGGSAFLHVAISNIPAFISGIPSSITTFLFILIAACMMSYELDRIHAFTKKIVSPNIQKIQDKIASHFKNAVVGYLRAQLVLVFITACIIMAGLFILQVEHALTIVLFAAIADIIPYVGTGIIFIPWIIFSFFTGNYHLTIGLSILYGFVVILRQILEPKVLSSSIGVHPLVMIIGMFVGLQAFGIIGVLISPIILVTINGLVETGVVKHLFDYIKG